jgi:hypothetical protein
VLDDYIAELNASNALNYTRGEFEMVGVRGAVLPIDTVAKFLRELDSGCGLPETMFETGRFQGRLSVDSLGRRNDMGKRAYMQKAVNSANVMGLGELELESFDLESEMVAVLVSNLPEERDGLDRQLLAEFWTGTLHSIAEELFDSEVGSDYEVFGSELLLRSGSAVR